MCIRDRGDFTTFTFAVRALEAAGLPLQGGGGLLVTYGEEVGGGAGPKGVADQGLTRPRPGGAGGVRYHGVTAAQRRLPAAGTGHGQMGAGARARKGGDARGARGEGARRGRGGERPAAHAV